MVRRSWFVVVAAATVLACLRCLHAQQPAPQSGFGAPGRGCTLSLVQQGREAGWVVRLKETEKARLAPLAWPATRKEAWQACQKFLDGKREARSKKEETGSWSRMREETGRRRKHGKDSNRGTAVDR